MYPFFEVVVDKMLYNVKIAPFPFRISCLFSDYGADTECSFVVVLQVTTTQNDAYNVTLYVLFFLVSI